MKLDVVQGGSVTRGEPVNEVGDAVRKARRGYESDVLGLHRVCDGRAVREEEDGEVSYGTGGEEPREDQTDALTHRGTGL